MNEDKIITLPAPLDDSELGPRLQLGISELIITYDFRSAEGTTADVTIIFSGIIHVEWKPDWLCEHRDIGPFRGIRYFSLPDSVLQERFGGRVFSKTSDQPLHEYILYFDHHGSLRVVAENCYVEHDGCRIQN